jgi:long-chain acyl-CoA synthetase
MHTGDIGYRGPGKHVHIVDRKKDMIITAGYKIFPVELEQVIAMHPAVAMVAVSAVVDEIKGELAKAFVVLKADARISEEELLDHCREHLAPYKVPRALAFVAELPTTSTGKIMRRALREEPRNDPQKS